MTPFYEALDIVLSDSIHPVETEIVPLTELPGRIIAEDIYSGVDIPPLNNSAMDGYAVVSADTSEATGLSPALLKVTGEIPAGADFRGIEVKPGTAVKIMTGAPVPDGADSVVKVEDTEENDGIVKIFTKAKQNENIRSAGEDIKSGRLVLKAGTKTGSAHIGLLASVNNPEVSVYKAPSVAIVSTGDEIVEVGEELRPGCIRNSNAYTLISEVKRCGAKPFYAGIAGDTIEQTIKKFRECMGHDVIISTGGVSMGDYDFVGEVIKRLGIEIKIKTIKMKPGKPLIFGRKDKMLFFGLPGNPVSTMVSFEQFVRPALLKMSGAEKLKRPFLNAELTEDINKKPERRHFLRGIFSIKEGKIFVRTTGDQGSGILSSMADSNCLIVLPEDQGQFKSGTPVMIQLTSHEEID